MVSDFGILFVCKNIAEKTRFVDWEKMPSPPISALF